MSAPQPRLLWCGDTAVTIEFGETIDPEANAMVLALDRAVRDGDIPGLVEAVPTYRSLTVHLDPCATEPNRIEASLLALIGAVSTETTPRRLWRIPVVYGGSFGIDLADVAAHHGLSADEVVSRHAAADYRVAMNGFLPGYAYLSGLDPSLALSRRESPRPVTPAGTISIGGVQALVASIAAPSGWHLLGRTPVRAFLPGRDPVFLFEPGDTIRFLPIEPERWDELDRAAGAGECIVECETTP
ncbi:MULTISPECIES: 5-oxoprolinase subunit PxpB [unclassified Methylobacterium]|uniref:5-oxoprolinase subunit PxpB n=1 Tax=unclassified Methylobacterium TaxID=2615210 RepID=UPI0006F7BDF6|nr:MULTISPECIES: 5-oxoprolinase subunit PxpB [unclassified Methylobacterium]KQO60117.1 allophanate hydrolase [Methylobacterium sp. Leaf86]KQO95512.1 allophanate hydrolase [Methylobacterium sp. Leaf91]